MRNAERDNSIFSDRNIRFCIAFDYWLKVAIDHVKSEKKDFLLNMQRTLHTKWQLTRGQISGINSWGVNLRKQVDDFPLLDEETFEGVTTPQFLSQKPRRD
jgi:hypothetical protein